MNPNPKPNASPSPSPSPSPNPNPNPYPNPNQVESPPLALRRTLLDAAEADGVGLRLRPQRGLAAVFWTHTAEGLDPYSWHAGARLPPQVTGGKLLVQKFKALPRGCRPSARQGLGCAVRLPAQFTPPPVV